MTFNEDNYFVKYFNPEMATDSDFDRYWSVREKFTDVSGLILTPSPQGRDCAGNGKKNDIECCCDECSYFLYCFPTAKKAGPHGINEEG